MSQIGLKKHLSKGKLTKLKLIDLDICESCILGKQEKVNFFRGGRAQKSRKLELVHTNLWGPLQVSSLKGSWYYLTFIDNYSRNV